MRIQGKLDAVHKWDHKNHYLTLALVAAAALANALEELVRRLYSRHISWFTRDLTYLNVTQKSIEVILQFVDSVALVLVILDISIYLIFSRNIGKEIAIALSRKNRTSNIFPAESPPMAATKPYRYQALPISPGDVEFVSSSTGAAAQTLFDLNYTCFEGTAFEMKRDAIVSRNRALIEKNSHGFMLVRDPLRESSSESDDYIGFSCVLPINEIGADYYLNGLIKDRDIRASVLCADREPCGTVLVFAVALRREFRRIDGLASRFYPFLLRCTEHHIKTIIDTHRNPGGARVWAQAEFRALDQHFLRRGFVRESGKKSGDGFDLYCREFLQNETALL